MAYIPLDKLEIYILARSLSREAWDIYITLEKNLQFSIGNQWIRAVDSVGANIAEGYRRYHSKDKIRFYYIARACYQNQHIGLRSYTKESLLHKRSI